MFRGVFLRGTGIHNDYVGLFGVAGQILRGDDQGFPFDKSMRAAASNWNAVDMASLELLPVIEAFEEKLAGVLTEGITEEALEAGIR